MSIKTVLMAAIGVLLCGSTARAVECSTSTVSSVLVIQFKGCDDPPQTPEKINIDVEDTSINPPRILRDQQARWDKDQGAWIAELDGQVRVEQSRVFPKTSKVRAYCRFGKAAKVPKSETGCGGKYEFYCDPEPWKLQVMPMPLKGKFEYELLHSEPVPNRCTENGTFAFPPKGFLSAVGRTETVKVRIETPAGIFLCFYPVTFELLEQTHGVRTVPRDDFTPEKCRAPAAVKTNPTVQALDRKKKEQSPDDLSGVQFSW